MPAILILDLARVSRRFIVSAGTRKARAISSVVSPATARSVSATCASRASAGWQHMKTSSSRSSGIGGPSMASSPGPRGSGSASSGSFAASTRSRRSRSMARCRAVVTSQAPGLSGIPAPGQRCAATANASAVASSARSKSPK